jgi:hypothetical protein
MNRKILLVVIIIPIVMACLGATSIAWAFDQKEVLRGLKGVKVVVINISPDIERLGLTQNQIQNNVETQIRKVGIKVFKTFNPPAMSALFIDVHAINPYQAKSIVVYSINVLLFENAYLERGVGTVGDLKEVRAADWVSGSVGLIGTSHINDIYKKVELQVDKFISDYLAVNQG